MSNPARELLTIFRAWRDVKANSNRPDRRRSPSGNDSQVLTSSLAAMKHLTAVDATLDEWERGGIDVTLNREYVKRWARIVLSYPHNWQAEVRIDTQFPGTVIDNLEMLATQFDLIERLQPLVVSHIQRFVDAVQATLDDDESVDEEFRSYIQHLLEAVVSGLSHGDSSQLREDLQHLWFAVFAAEEFTESKGKWRKTAQEYGKATFAQTVASIPAIVIQALTP